MLIYSYNLFGGQSQPVRTKCYEWWHPADQEELFLTRLHPSERITGLSFWLGADADSISDASLYDAPATLASDYYMWGGADMEAV